MGPAPRLLIGSLEAEHLLVRPTRYEQAEPTNFYDANWLRTTIELRVGAFRAEYEGTIMNVDFVRFREAVKLLHETLRGEATFDPLEPWVLVRLVGDGRGHVEAKCTATDRLGMGSELRFTLELDQTMLPAILADLEMLSATFSVRGEPPSR